MNETKFVVAYDTPETMSVAMLSSVVTITVLNVTSLGSIGQL